MIIKVHKLNRNKERVSQKEIDLTKFEKIGRTGCGLVLKYKKGKTIEIFGEYLFDKIYTERQKQSDKSFESRSYSYKRIDENKSDSIKNRARDKNGKPIKVYDEKEDIYKESGIGNLFLIDDENWEIYSEYMKKSKMINYYYFNDEFIYE